MSHLRIMFITGTHADWSKLQPLAEAAAMAFNIEFFITGMHMLAEYGLTKNLVHTFPNAAFHEYVNHQPGDDTTTIHSNTTNGLRNLFSKYKPDLLVVHGDRVEALAACMVAAHEAVRLAHVEGSEVSGSIDNSYHYACMHFSTCHFVCSNRAECRLIANGQHCGTVFKIGSPELDTHLRDSGVMIDAVKQKYNIAFDVFEIVTFHSVTSKRDSMREQAQDFFGALTASDRNFIIIMLNNDPGSDDIREVIVGLDGNRFYRIPNVEFDDFSVLMKNCEAIVGNSSATVRECPFLRKPSLNIGSRQQGRVEDTPSIMHSSAKNGYNFSRFFETMWGRTFASHHGYGNGNAAGEFVEVLLQDAFWMLPLQKIYCDTN